MLDGKRIVNTFLELVKIDSPSGKEENVRKYLEGYLKKLGVKSKKDRYGNLIAYVPGEGKPAMLAAHMDTVQPGEGIKPVVKGDVIKSDGKTILAVDDKSGIAAILEAVRYVLENEIAHRSLELVFTREEEIGLVGAFNLDYKLIKSKEGMAIDGGDGIGKITIAAPFITTIGIRVFGKAAHAGVEPEKGINAIAIASKAIAGVKWGRIDKETTTNVGVISGGKVRNGVPDLVEIKAEARSHVQSKMNKEVQKIKKSFEKAVKRTGAKLEFTAKLECKGYKYDTKDKFIKHLAEIYDRVGVRMECKKSGGASDANVFAGKGIKVVDVSTGGKGPHTKEETIKISELEKNTEFIIEFIMIEQ